MNTVARDDAAESLARLAGASVDAGLRPLLAALAELGPAGAIAVCTGGADGRTISAVRAVGDPRAVCSSSVLSGPPEWNDVARGPTRRISYSVDALDGAGAHWLKSRGVRRMLTVPADDGLLLHFGWASDSDIDDEAVQQILDQLETILELVRRARQAEQHAAPAPHRDAPAGNSKPAPGRTATVLLVEDEELVREATAALLESNNHRVHACARAVDALALIDSQGSDIDLVVTDVVMPDIDGVDLARRIELVAPTMKVLFVSGFTAEAYHRIELNERRAFLQKPYTEPVLLAKVHELLDDS